MTILNETEFTIDDIMSQAIESYEYPQGSDGWFEERLGIPTASMFKAICKRNKNGTVTADYNKYLIQLLVERLTGKRPRFTSLPIEWGKAQEELAATRYEEVTGNVTQEVGFKKHKTIEAGASLDRQVGKDGQIEIKCPNTATHLVYMINDQLPDDYFYQVHGQLWISGNKWCDFVSHDPDLPAGLDLFIKRVDRDEAVVKEIENEIKEFVNKLDELTNKLKEKIGG